MISDIVSVIGTHLSERDLSSFLRVSKEIYSLDKQVRDENWYWVKLLVILRAGRDLQDFIPPTDNFYASMYKTIRACMKKQIYTEALSVFSYIQDVNYHKCLASFNVQGNHNLKSSIVRYHYQNDNSEIVDVLLKGEFVLKDPLDVCMTRIAFDTIKVVIDNKVLKDIHLDMLCKSMIISSRADVLYKILGITTHCLDELFYVALNNRKIEIATYLVSTRRLSNTCIQKIRTFSNILV